MGLIKFLLSIVFLPVLVGVTRAFCGELIAARDIYHLFSCGVVTYVVTHLFFVNFHGLYQGGQKLFSDGLKFSPFLASFVPLVLPLFPVILSVTFFICAKFFSMREWEPYFIFFIGLTFAMHLILTAHIMREEDSGIFKAHYFFVMSLGIVLNLAIIAALLDLNFASFTFLNFFDNSVTHVKDIYLYIYQRLFVTGI
jgi:hypothetical protein